MATKKAEKDQDKQQNPETVNESGMELDEVVSKAYLLESEVVSLTQDELERLNAIETLAETLDRVAAVMATEELIDQSWVQEGLWDLQKGIMCWPPGHNPEFNGALVLRSKDR